MLGPFIAYLRVPMGDSLDRLFLFPRAVLASRKIDLYDAINLVIYAKLPLISARRGKELVAGFIRRDGVRVVPALLSALQGNELLGKYGSEIASFRYPIGPSQYEPLLEKMVEADQHALPYFFHEHHQVRERRRRAAMFADLHAELAGLVSRKEVALQITESERTYLLGGGAWMTEQTLRAFLERHGVTPWWESEENLRSHERIERLLLSDVMGVSRAESSDGYDEQQLPSYLFGKMLLSRTSPPRGYSLAREPARLDASAEPATDADLTNTSYRPGTRKKMVDSRRESTTPKEEAFVDDGEPTRCAMTPPSRVDDHSNPSEASMWTRTEQIANGRDQNRQEEAPVQTEDPDETMLTKREVADLLGLKSTTTVDNYRNDFEDFPEAVVYGANTLRWSKRKIERWKKARPAR